MYFIIAISCIVLPLILIQWAYMIWVGVAKEAKHHQKSDYIDQSFKLNVIQSKVDETI